MHQVIAEKQEAIAEVCRRYDVDRLEIFGSAAGELISIQRKVTLRFHPD